MCAQVNSVLTDCVSLAIGFQPSTHWIRGSHNVSKDVVDVTDTEKADRQRR